MSCEPARKSGTAYFCLLQELSFRESWGGAYLVNIEEQVCVCLEPLQLASYRVSVYPAPGDLSLVPSLRTLVPAPSPDGEQ